MRCLPPVVAPIPNDFSEFPVTVHKKLFGICIACDVQRKRIPAPAFSIDFDPVCLLGRLPRARSKA